MIGTPSQIEWAELIKPRVNEEFNRVSRALESATLRRNAEVRAETQELLAILEEKRSEVMAHDEAGYFIRYWQEITDQVRLMISTDVRYGDIRDRRKLRALAKGVREP